MQAFESQEWRRKSFSVFSIRLEIIFVIDSDDKALSKTQEVIIQMREDLELATSKDTGALQQSLVLTSAQYIIIGEECMRKCKPNFINRICHRS